MLYNKHRYRELGIFFRRFLENDYGRGIQQAMKTFLHNTWKHRPLLVLALPAVLVLFFFSYVPMAGLVLAFKQFDFAKGIWGSPFNGIKNFQILMQSKRDFIRITRNTLAYYVLFTALGTFLNVVLAIAIDQCVFKKTSRVFQTVMIIPVFVSYAAVQFIVMAYISANTGIIANMTGIKNFYTQAKYWPTILTIVKMWNSVGYGSVLYMSVLAGIDTSLYEAAQIDGATKWQQIKYVTLPSLVPMITVISFSPSVPSCAPTPVCSIRSRETAASFTARHRSSTPTSCTRSPRTPASDSPQQQRSSSRSSVSC